MERSFEEQWSDFLGRYGTRHCSFCKNQALDFSNPKQDTFAGINVITIVCRKCGHIEIFDVSEIIREADEIDKDYRDKGWR